MVILKSVAIALLALALLLVLLGQLGLFKGRAPQGLGVSEGRLKRPSFTPNSVSSQADLWSDHPQRDYARIEPITAAGGDGATALRRLRAVVEAMPGAKIVETRDDYLYAQFTTMVLGFVDDVEFWFDPQQRVLQLRSASRVGRKDFGVNRARIETIRQRLSASA